MVPIWYNFDETETDSTEVILSPYEQMLTGGRQITVIPRVPPLTRDWFEKAIPDPSNPGTTIRSIHFPYQITKLPVPTLYRQVYDSPSVIAEEEYAKMHSAWICGYTGRVYW